MNDINTWQQGRFIESRTTEKWTDDEITKANRHESFLVRPFPKENAVCKANSPHDAKWIASRLNLASDLEQLAYGFATGNSDGEDLRDYVLSKIN